VIKTLEAQVSQFLLGCNYLVTRGIGVQDKTPLVTFPWLGVFPPKSPSIAPAEMSNIPR
jgi:hypothetical protein